MFKQIVFYFLVYTTVEDGMMGERGEIRLSCALMTMEIIFNPRKCIHIDL